jgi:midasin (ATPase involved in ribosome maturation)
MKSNENENTAYPNLWNAAKAVLRREFIAMSTYEREREREREDQIDSLIMHFKLLEKQEQIKPKISMYKKILRIRAEVNEIETNYTKNQ